MPGEEPRTDGELVPAAAGGDAAAFEALYHRHKALVHAWARRWAGPDLAADVTQEAFAYLVRRLPKLDFHGSLSAFLYPVVRHAASAALRRERKQG